MNNDSVKAVPTSDSIRWRTSDRNRRRAARVCIPVAALTFAAALMLLGPTGAQPARSIGLPRAPSSGRPTPLRTATTSTTNDASSPAANTAPNQPSSSDASPPAAASESAASSRDPGPPPTAPPGTSANHGSTGSPSSFPPAPSCVINASELSPGESAHCGFTATERGGWAIQYSRSAGFDGPRVYVSVYRPGTSDHAGTYYVYRGAAATNGCDKSFDPTTTTSNPCHPVNCDDAIIQPGDMVNVRLDLGWDDVEHETQVGAGASWGC